MQNQKIFGKPSRSLSKQSTQNPQNQVQARKHISSVCSSKDQQNACVFCQKMKANKTYTYAPLLNKALFSKYSSSQNYYYSKDINDILDNESTSAVVFFRDLECITEDEEYLKRFYPKRDFTNKYKALLEYYKYHKDIPRLFMQKVYITINKFHEKKRRIEYAIIKRKLNIPDEDYSEQKKEKKQKKIKMSDDDLSVGKLKYLLKDLKLEQNSYHLRKVDVSSSVALQEFVKMVGSKYDYLGQVSGLLTVNQSSSYFMPSVDVSSIQDPQFKNQKKITVINNKKSILNQASSKLQQSQQLSHQQSTSQYSSQQQLKQHQSFEKLNFNKLINHQYQQEIQSQRGEQSYRNGDKKQETGSPLRYQHYKRVYSQIEGFSNMMQKQQQMKSQQKQQNYKPIIEQKKQPETQRKMSANFIQQDYQLKLPNRQNSIFKFTDIQNNQINLIKNRVASQMQQYDEEHSHTHKFGSTTERNYRSNSKMSTKQLELNNFNTQFEKQVINKPQKKMQSFPIATLKNLSVKQQTDQQLQKLLIVNNNNSNSQKQVHYRTKSTDTYTYKSSPPKKQQKPVQVKYTNNIIVQGSGRKSADNINLNAIINIYIDQAKQSIKGKGGSQTTRINSPPRTQYPQQISDMYNHHKASTSPKNRKK